MVELNMTAEQIATANQHLSDAKAETILRWAVRTFHDKLTMATAFGAEGCCLIHMLAEIEPSVRIFNLDTGYQFAETLDLRERIKERYGIEVEYIRPEMTVAEYEAEHGGPLYRIRPDQCCHDRKMLPLRQAVAGYAAWISAIRRDQTRPSRRGRRRAVGRQVQTGEGQSAAELDAQGRVGLHPQARHSLQPACTIGAIRASAAGPARAPVGDGEDERAGRWAGSVKKECGLHVIEVQDGGGI